MLLNDWSAGETSSPTGCGVNTTLALESVTSVLNLLSPVRTLDATVAAGSPALRLRGALWRDRPGFQC